MTPSEKKQITVQVTVKVPVEKAWKVFTTPEDIVHWNNASEDWHSPKAENDLRPGGKFSYRMEAKDGSFGFDFGGVFDEVKPAERLAYTIGDGRRVEITFSGSKDETKVVETFEGEESHGEDLQRTGWQAILDSFKKYAEEN